VKLVHLVGFITKEIYKAVVISLFLELKYFARRFFFKQETHEGPHFDILTF